MAVLQINLTKPIPFCVFADYFRLFEEQAHLMLISQFNNFWKKSKQFLFGRINFKNYLADLIE